VNCSTHKQENRKTEENMPRRNVAELLKIITARGTSSTFATDLVEIQRAIT